MRSVHHLHHIKIVRKAASFVRYMLLPFKIKSVSQYVGAKKYKSRLILDKKNTMKNITARKYQKKTPILARQKDVRFTVITGENNWKEKE